MRRTRGSFILGTSQDEDGIPDPPPVPTNLADAITALVNVTAENSCLLHEIALNNQIRCKETVVTTITDRRLHMLIL